jgi:hypothetical protein
MLVGGRRAANGFARTRQTEAEREEIRAGRFRKQSASTPLPPPPPLRPQLLSFANAPFMGGQLLPPPPIASDFAELGQLDRAESADAFQRRMVITDETFALALFAADPEVRAFAELKGESRPDTPRFARALRTAWDRNERGWRDRFMAQSKATGQEFRLIQSGMGAGLGCMPTADAYEFRIVRESR